MQKCEEFEINFPEWAVVAHFNSDTSGMDDEDIKLLTQWEEEMNGVCEEKGYHSWTLDLDTDEEIPATSWHGAYMKQIEPSFTNYPEFGLPCNCYCGAKVVFLNKDNAIGNPNGIISVSVFCPRKLERKLETEMPFFCLFSSFFVLAFYNHRQTKQQHFSKRENFKMARKITEMAVDAFMDGESFSKNNTRVYRDDRGRMVMELHGNRIASTVEGDDDTMIVSDCGWTTKTTYERLGHLIFAWTNGMFSASMRKGGVIIDRLNGTERQMSCSGIPFHRA